MGLVEGSVSIIKDGKEVNHLVASHRRPQFFGERALLANDVRAATVQVVSKTATTLSIGKASFDVLLRPSLVGPRRVVAAMTRRLLEDARERHVLRESYQARSASCSNNEGLIPVMLVEVFSDVLAAVRASLFSRHFAGSMEMEAAATQQRQ